MKSSRGLGWLAWVGVGGVGETMAETPSASCLICSFWRRRSFLKSLAFRHGGRLASAPTPAPQRKERRGGGLSKLPKLGGVPQKHFLIYFHPKDMALHFQSLSRWEYGGKEAVIRNNSIPPFWMWITTFLLSCCLWNKTGRTSKKGGDCKLLVLMSLKFGADFVSVKPCFWWIFPSPSGQMGCHVYFSVPPAWEASLNKELYGSNFLVSLPQ